jgi:hypothetical protein
VRRPHPLRAEWCCNHRAFSHDRFEQSQCHTRD